MNRSECHQRREEGLRPDPELVQVHCIARNHNVDHQRASWIGNLPQSVFSQKLTLIIAVPLTLNTIYTSKIPILQQCPVLESVFYALRDITSILLNN